MAATNTTIRIPTSSKKTTKSRRAKAVKGTKTAAKRHKKMSALDGAAKILAETGKAMNCKDMIEAMAQKKYWSSPAGKTPEATLYSAILREINVKAAKARFKKTGRGTFALTNKT